MDYLLRGKHPMGVVGSYVALMEVQKAPDSAKGKAEACQVSHQSRPR
jgi:hypothetical protein